MFIVQTATEEHTGLPPPLLKEATTTSAFRPVGILLGDNVFMGLGPQVVTRLTKPGSAVANLGGRLSQV